jgi:hypothetical protein
MKKLFLALAIGVISMTAALAQPQLYFGAGAGMNFSKLKFNSFQDEYTQYYYIGQDYSSSGEIGFQGALRLGIQFGETFSIQVEPSFFRQKLKIETQQLTSEYVRTAPNTYLLSQEGRRNWTMDMNSINVPILAKVKLFGDKFGMNGVTGISLNFHQSGTYSTEYKPTDDGNGVQAVKDNPIAYTIDDLGNVNTIYYSEQYPTGGSKLKFGNAQDSHFSGFGADLILGAGLFYKVDDDGKFKITLDWRMDFGLTNMYQSTRTDYLATINGTKTVRDIDDQTSFDVVRRRVDISGSQKLNSSVISIGVEFCPSCGF